jgi:alkylation response protein AidB-like acyl-CoA dehydrogenase
VLVSAGTVPHDPPSGDTGEQAALRDAVRRLLQRGGDDVWQRLTGELGLTGLAVPERFGGAGATLAEVAVAVEETGRVLLPLPYLSTALGGAIFGSAVSGSAVSGSAVSGGAVSGGAAPGGGDAGAVAEFAAGIADGSVRAAFVFTGSVDVADGRALGAASHVLDGACADVFLVRAGSGSGSGLYAVRAADATVRAVGTLDQTRTQATVSFRGSAATAVGYDPGRAEELLRVLLAVESAGAAAHCLDATVRYLKTRVQFGRPLGAFQALRHRCADLAVLVASAQATARAAVAAAVSGPDQRLMVLGPLAKRYCADVFWQVAAEMIQLHGGIGFTWEHEAHRYLKRAKTTQLLHGSPESLRRLVAERSGLLPSPRQPTTSM